MIFCGWLKKMSQNVKHLKVIWGLSRDWVNNVAKIIYYGLFHKTKIQKYLRNTKLSHFRMHRQNASCQGMITCCTKIYSLSVLILFTKHQENIVSLLLSYFVHKKLRTTATVIDNTIQLPITHDWPHKAKIKPEKKTFYVFLKFMSIKSIKSSQHTFIGLTGGKKKLKCSDNSCQPRAIEEKFPPCRL